MKGYTFIEIIITIFITSVGIMALSRLTMAVIKANSVSSKVTAAAAIAQDKIEKLKRQGYINLQDGIFNVNNVKNGIDIEWSVKKNNPVINTASVVVTAKWNIGNAKKKVVFSTVIGK